MVDFIVIESGGTKSTWAFGNKNDGLIQTIESVGLHPQELTSEKTSSIQQLLLNVEYNSKTEIYFYGAGCSDINKPLITNFFQLFLMENLSIHTDLEGACIATLKNDSGYTAILGTGAIAAKYDGEKIVRYTSGLGYLLGDEGSGFDLGKRLLNFYFRNQLGENINIEIEKYFGSRNQILQEVYSANGRMKIAGLAKIIHKHKDKEPIKTLIQNAFHDFYTTALKDFDDVKEVSFIGSIAYNFQDDLRAILANYSIHTNKIFEAAISELFEYHFNLSKEK